MAKFAYFLGGILLGISVSTTAAYLLWQEYAPDQAEVWTTSKSIVLENGMTIPIGTDLVVNAYMPEGFVSLNLSVNVEGDSFTSFHRRKEDGPFLRIPYWIAE